MAENSKIQWTDHTASPWHGCSKVHTGCENCYAMNASVRNPSILGVWGDDGVRVKSKSFIDNLRKWNREGEKAGRVVSVFPSICDPFEDRPELVDWRNEMFAAADELPWVRLLLLTKRPENVRRMYVPYLLENVPGHVSQNEGDGKMLRARPNVWIGTSVSDQETADKWIPELLKLRDLTPVLFVSAEPLLGAINLRTGIYEMPSQGRRGTTLERGLDGNVDWLIVGGESGPHARPCNVEWIRSTIEQCKAAGVPCFAKQLGSYAVVPWSDVAVASYVQHGRPSPDSVQLGADFKIQSLAYDPSLGLIQFKDRKGGDWSEWPETLRVRQFPPTATVGA